MIQGKDTDCIDVLLAASASPSPVVAGGWEKNIITSLLVKINFSLNCNFHDFNHHLFLGRCCTLDFFSQASFAPRLAVSNTATPVDYCGQEENQDLVADDKHCQTRYQDEHEEEEWLG